MRKQTALVFDDITQATVIGDNPFYTSTEYSHLLSQGSQTSVQCIADKVAGSGTIKLALWYETSPNELHWANKTGTETILPFTLTVGATNLLPYACDDGAFVSFGSSRLKLILNVTALSVTVHVKIYITTRDKARVLFNDRPAAVSAVSDPARVPLDGDGSWKFHWGP